VVLQQYENGGPPWLTSILDEDTEPKDLPWIRRALGDVPVPTLYYEHKRGDNDPFIQQLRGLFPEATLLLVDEVKTESLPPDGRLRRPKP
jgi:hypothetical protein